MCACIFGHVCSCGWMSSCIFNFQPACKTCKIKPWPISVQPLTPNKNAWGCLAANYRQDLYLALTLSKCAKSTVLDCLKIKVSIKRSKNMTNFLLLLSHYLFSKSFFFNNQNLFWFRKKRPNFIISLSDNTDLFYP